MEPGTRRAGAALELAIDRGNAIHQPGPCRITEHRARTGMKRLVQQHRHRSTIWGSRSYERDRAIGFRPALRTGRRVDKCFLRDPDLAGIDQLPATILSGCAASSARIFVTVLPVWLVSAIKASLTA